MTLATVLLGVLADGPAHGYDLKRAHDERFPAARPLAFGQVYATLARLERDGLVEQAESGKSGGPERIVYAITGSGQDHFRTWLDEPERPGPYAADELVRKTVSALYADADADGFLARQREVHLSALRDLVRRRTSAADVAERIAVDHTVAHLDADLRWLDDARARVREQAAPAGRTGSPT